LNRIATHQPAVSVFGSTAFRSLGFATSLSLFGTTATFFKAIAQAKSLQTILLQALHLCSFGAAFSQGKWIPAPRKITGP
jgi:hypothetical protein